MLDKGFENSYSGKEIESLLGLLSSDELLSDWLHKLYQFRNIKDFKRGEFYPEILRASSLLKNRLAQLFSTSSPCISLNVGSNGSIDSILTYLKVKYGNEATMLITSPTYFRNYNSAQARAISLIKVKLKNSDWNLDVNSFISAIKTEKPKLVSLVSPNNPTGIAIKRSDLRRIITSIPSDTLIMLDRTLASIESEYSSKELLDEFPDHSLVILHSFSKYFGMSHLRLGFTICLKSKLAEDIARFQPLGLNYEALIKAIALTDNINSFSATQRIKMKIVDNKKYLSYFCSKNQEFNVTDFQGNYCLISSNLGDIQRLKAHLINSNAYIMDGKNFPEPINNIFRFHTASDPHIVKEVFDSYPTKA